MAYNKYQKLRLEGSQDGINWEVVTPYEYKKGEIIAENSKDCGGSGTEVQYRWITVDGEFMCINNDKYTVIKKQVYDDDTSTWVDVEPEETTYGELVEASSGYCGYGEYWSDTEKWSCASADGIHTTMITCYNGGYCDWIYGNTSGRVTTETYYIDTASKSVYITAVPSGERYPLRSMVINGITTSSKSATLNGTSDNVVSLYFYSKPIVYVYSGYQNEWIISSKPTFYVESGETTTITASSSAAAEGGGYWKFDHWSVVYDYSSASPVSYEEYRENPLTFKVNSDCMVNLYYGNEAVKMGYTLIYNDGVSVDIENTDVLRPSNWFFDSTWFIENWFNTIGTCDGSVGNTLDYIASSCFTDYTYGSWASGLQAITFPTVHTIYSSAFTGLSYLYSVSIPKCKSIYNDAFKSCTALSVISLPSAQYLGSRCFMGCTSLKTVYMLGESLCSIGGSVFYSCTNLKSIIVPSSLYASYRTLWSSWKAYIVSY